MLRAGAAAAAAVVRDRLERAEILLRLADMPIHAAVARLRAPAASGAGGGDRQEGVEEADRFLREQGIRFPERMADVLAPGSWKT